MSEPIPRKPEWGILVIADAPPRAAYCLIETTPALRKAGFAARMIAEDAGAALDGMSPRPPWPEHPGRARLAPPERDTDGLASRGLDARDCERQLPRLGDTEALAEAVSELLQLIPPEVQGSGDYAGATA